MADQALAPASAGTVDGAPSFQDTSSSLETPSQLLSVVSGGMPPNLLSAKLLDVVLPSSKNGISPLRVRRRGVRRLLYQDEPVEQEDQSGDLGEHSLANDYIRHSSSKVAQPDLQSPVYLQKRLVSLRRKREDSPVPSPNLIDALTSLLSPPSGGTSGSKKSSDGLLGLGILGNGSPLTGLGILTPASEDDPDPFSKDGPAGDFFVE